ncbi:DNA-directed RNA polymerase subunit H (RpoH/RPB5) [Pedobacter sp. UYP24]
MLKRYEATKDGLPKILNPIPVADKMDVWEADYAKMKEDMILNG